MLTSIALHPANALFSKERTKKEDSDLSEEAPTKPASLQEIHNLLGTDEERAREAGEAGETKEAEKTK